MTRCLELSGVGYFAPTVTSSDQEIYRELRNIFREYSQHESATTAINFEGPFINKSKGGMHAAQYIHDMDRAYQDIYYDLIEDTRVIMTVAPEASRADIIAKMVADCVIISAGHTSVGAFEAEAFFDLGVSNVTHIFNGMTPVTGREPGITGLALSRPDIYCSMIVDGHHLHPEAVNLVWRLKGSDRIYLISDGMPHLGSEIEKYQYGDVEIENVDGALKDAAGTLSGTKVPINEMARNVVDITGARIEKVVNTITSVPASVIRRSTEIGDIQVGMAASINIIDRSFNVKYMMKDGAFRVRPDV
jgi:N-acetylglucosamine-6-phosphate deacetylase